MGQKVHRPLEHAPAPVQAGAPATADAANDSATGRLADLSRPQIDLRPVRGMATSVGIGLGLWAVVGALVWLALH